MDCTLFHTAPSCLTGRSSIVPSVRQEQEPAGSEIHEMAPGVLRLQLPIQMPGLGHVNCYAIPDGDGVAIVDPGLPGPSSWKVLQQRLDAAGVKVNNIHTVLITHA